MKIKGNTSSRNRNRIQPEFTSISFDQRRLLIDSYQISRNVNISLQEFHSNQAYSTITQKNKNKGVNNPIVAQFKKIIKGKVFRYGEESSSVWTNEVRLSDKFIIRRNKLGR